MNEFRGIMVSAKGRDSLAVGKLPGRARPSMYWHRGIEIIPIASFRSEADAHEFCLWIEKMLSALGVEVLEDVS